MTHYIYTRFNLRRDAFMKTNKAKVISSWKPTNNREAAAMKELLMNEMGVTTTHHQGGTGKLAPNSGRMVR